MEMEMLSATYAIEEENLEQIAEDAKDFAISKGIAMRVADLSPDARVPLSFCLVPSIFPQKYFELAVEIQPHINYVLHQIAHSKTFLKSCLSSTIEVDEFTSNIFKIYEAVEDRKQQLSLGLIRSDYLLDSTSSGEIIGLKQVENNTIASSFGGLAPSVRELHAYVLDRRGLKDCDNKLPLNESVHELAKGIISAWDAYENLNAIVLFVVEELTLNICDQRALEYAILEFENRIQVIRCTFIELRSCLELREQKLFVKNQEVAVVYFRCGYVPEHYELEDWETRFLIERSCAIKCPSTGLHLAGTKRVQMQLTQPGVLEMFVPENIAHLLRTCFVYQQCLDMNEEGSKAVSLALENPHKYILKPEREGGGHNIYGADVKKLLQDIGSLDQRKAYILVERINSPPIPNCIIQRDKKPKACNVACELGVFGVILGNKENIYINNEAGHLLRSKEISSNEGGIAAGFGALDSPYFL